MSIYHVARTLKGSPSSSRRDGCCGYYFASYVSWSTALEFGSGEWLMEESSQRLLVRDETMGIECLIFCHLTLDFSKLILHSCCEITICKHGQFCNTGPSSATTTSSWQLLPLNHFLGAVQNQFPAKIQVNARYAIIILGVHPSLYIVRLLQLMIIAINILDFFRAALSSLSFHSVPATKTRQSAGQRMDQRAK